MAIEVDSTPFSSSDGRPVQANASGPGNYVSDPRGGQGVGSGPGNLLESRPTQGGPPGYNPASVPSGGTYPGWDPSPAAPGGVGTPGNGQKPFKLSGG